MSENHPVLVIGAGIAGLFAALRLASANIPVLVLDKGRGMGGRMATRRIGEATFDHGAQFFSAKTPGFQRFVKEGAETGTLKDWWPAIPGIQHPRWIGSAGMNTVPKSLAQHLTIFKGKKVTYIEQKYFGWEVFTEDLESYRASALLVTIPAPQALELLEKSVPLLAIDSLAPLRQITYDPCLALLATLDRPSNIPFPGGLQIDDPTVSWLADNFQKGISTIPAVTVHASPGFSRRYLDGDLQAAGHLMLEAVSDYVPLESVMDCQVHRWRYSLASQRHPAPFWQAGTEMPLLFGGDGFGIGNVEGAYLSGQMMADALIAKA